MEKLYTCDSMAAQGPAAVGRTASSNGHSTVWGSFFHVGAMRWWYADNHLLLQNSYRTGENGRRANDEVSQLTCDVPLRSTVSPRVLPLTNSVRLPRPVT